MPPVTPVLAFPLRVRAGRFLTREQDSRGHREDQAEVLIRTRPGMLDHDPRVGLRDLVARTSPAAPEVLDAVRRHVGEGFTATEDESQLAQRVRRVTLELTDQED